MPTPITRATPLATAAAAYLDWFEQKVAAKRRSWRSLYNHRHALSWLNWCPEDGDPLGAIALGDLCRSAIIGWSDFVLTIPGKRKDFCATRDRTALRSLKALLAWCADKDAVVPGLAARIETDYRSPPSRALNREQLECFRAVLRVRRQTADVQALRVIADNGARPGEVRLATGANYDAGRGVLVWPRGKNGKPRIIVLSKASISIVQIRARNGGKAAYLFPSNERPGAPYTAQHLNRLCKVVARDADIEAPDEVSLKTFRHTFATVSYEEGAALADVSRSLSHSSMRTTTDWYLHNAVDPGARRVNALINPPRSGRAGVR